jgi:hypothetical protein
MTTEEIEALIDRVTGTAMALVTPGSVMSAALNRGGIPNTLEAAATALRFLLKERETLMAALQPFATTAEQIDREVQGARSQITQFETPFLEDEDVRISVFPVPDEAFVLHAARWHDPHPVTEMIGLQMCHLRAARNALSHGDSTVEVNNER